MLRGTLSTRTGLIVRSVRGTSIRRVRRMTQTPEYIDVEVTYCVSFMIPVRVSLEAAEVGMWAENRPIDGGLLEDFMNSGPERNDVFEDHIRPIFGYDVDDYYIDDVKIVDGDC